MQHKTPMPRPPRMALGSKRREASSHKRDRGREPRAENSDGGGGVPFQGQFTENAVQGIAEAGTQAEKHRGGRDAPHPGGKQAGHQHTAAEGEQEGADLAGGDRFLEAERREQHHKDGRGVQQDGGHGQGTE